MSHAEIVVLGLLSDGPASAYELVRRVEGMRIENWAQVAESTLYAVLKRLADGGMLVAETEPGERQRQRTLYRITAEGRKRLEELVAEGLESSQPAYSDRLVAAVFGQAVGLAGSLQEAAGRSRGAVRRLRDQQQRDELSTIGAVVVRYYARVMAAEADALSELAELAASPPTFLTSRS